MEVDYIELMKQRREELLKGEYARVEVIVGVDDNMPYCNLDVKNCTDIEVMALMYCLDTIKDRLIEERPQVALYRKFIKNHIDGEIRLDKKGERYEEI